MSVFYKLLKLHCVYYYYVVLRVEVIAIAMYLKENTFNHVVHRDAHVMFLLFLDSLNCY